MYTVHRRNLAIKSNGILVGLRGQGKAWVSANYKLSVLFLYEKRKIMLGWCLIFDSVYIYIAC